MQAKRIQVNETNVGVGGTVNVGLPVLTTPREEVNFHNIWGSVSVEPQDTDANCQGTWVLYVSREDAPNVIWTDGTVNAETSNAIVIA